MKIRKTGSNFIRGELQPKRAVDEGGRDRTKNEKKAGRAMDMIDVNLTKSEKGVRRGEGIERRARMGVRDRESGVIGMIDGCEWDGRLLVGC